MRHAVSRRSHEVHDILGMAGFSRCPKVQKGTVTNREATFEWGADWIGRIVQARTLAVRGGGLESRVDVGCSTRDIFSVTTFPTRRHCARRRQRHGGAQAHFFNKGCRLRRICNSATLAVVDPAARVGLPSGRVGPGSPLGVQRAVTLISCCPSVTVAADCKDVDGLAGSKRVLEAEH